jgi:hypothetical protein
MAAHLAVNHDAHYADKDALAWLTVQLGGEPLVPPTVRERANPSEIIDAALAQLRALAFRVRTPTVDFRDWRGESLRSRTRTSRACNPEPAAR